MNIVLLLAIPLAIGVLALAGSFLQDQVTFDWRLIPIGFIGFVILSVFRSVLRGSETKTENKLLFPEYEDIEGRHTMIDSNHGVLHSKKGDRVFMVADEGDGMFVQELSKRGEPISGKVYADGSASQSEKKLAEYLKVKINTGRKLSN